MATNTTNINYAKMTNEELEAIKAERIAKAEELKKKAHEAYAKYELRMGSFAEAEFVKGNEAVKVEVLDDGIRFVCWDEPAKDKGNAYRHSHDVSCRCRNEWVNGYDSKCETVMRMTTYSRDVVSGDAYGVAYYKFIGELVTRLDDILNEWKAARKDCRISEVNSEINQAIIDVRVVEQVLIDREVSAKKFETFKAMKPGAKFTSKHCWAKECVIEKVTKRCVFVAEGWHTRRYDIDEFINKFVDGTNKFVAA